MYTHTSRFELGAWAHAARRNATTTVVEEESDEEAGQEEEEEKERERTDRCLGACWTNLSDTNVPRFLPSRPLRFWPICVHGITRIQHGGSPPSFEDACGPPLFASGIRIRPRSCPNLWLRWTERSREIGEMPGNVLFFAYARSYEDYTGWRDIGWLKGEIYDEGGCKTCKLNDEN